LLEAGLAATQEEIVERLATEGFPATQATISRDLDAVGAVRRHEGGRIVYELPERNGPPLAFGLRALTQFVRDVTPSGNLVVVKTFPGMASSVAALLDQSAVDGVVGTVAGDDTVLVVADERVGGRRLASRIQALGETA
ncbi:MAG: arginine repressor, partial [Candidatus Binatia bacterium]